MKKHTVSLCVDIFCGSAKEYLEQESSGAKTSLTGSHQIQRDPNIEGGEFDSDYSSCLHIPYVSLSLSLFPSLSLCDLLSLSLFLSSLPACSFSVSSCLSLPCSFTHWLTLFPMLCV